MTEQAAAARRAYKRKWAHNNPDKVKAAQARYWEKKAQQDETAPAEKAQQEPQGAA